MVTLPPWAVANVPAVAVIVAPSLSTAPVSTLPVLTVSSLVLTVSFASGYALEVARPLTEVDKSLRRIGLFLILIAGAGVAGAAALGLFVSRTALAPVKRLTDTAEKVTATGDLSQRIEVSGRDELSRLATSFNSMLAALEESTRAQRQLVADASHELRTPLTVIKGQIEVLAAQGDPSAEEVRRVERLVQGEIARMGRLVDDLLLLARSEHSQFLRLQSIDLVPYVAELWEGIVPLADRGFELGPVPAGTLRADPDRLAQALRNLLTNAIAHTEPGRGLVRLSAQQAPGGRLRFLVEDDGPGIAAAERERVFDRFNRTDSARDRASGGTGLGLAIVREIVERHGGGVRAIAQAHGGGVGAGESAAGGARIELEIAGFGAAQELPTDDGAAALRAPAPAPG